MSQTALASAAPALPEGNLVDYIMSFSKTLRDLTLELVRRFPNDPAMGRAKKRIIFAVGECPEYLIDEVGRALYKFRDPLKNGKADFFLKNEFDDERRRAAEGDPEKAALTDHIIPKVKDAWAVSTPKQKAGYMLQAQDMLYDYIDYLILKNHELARRQAR